MDFDVTKMMNEIQPLLTDYGLKLIGAIVVLIIGLWIAKVITRQLDKVYTKEGINNPFPPMDVHIQK